MIRPEKKRKKEAETLRDNLRPGNRITSIGGIVGTVEKVTDEDIYLTNGLVLKRWALRTIDETAPESGNAAVTYYEEDEDDKQYISQNKKDEGFALLFSFREREKKQKRKQCLYY